MHCSIADSIKIVPTQALVKNGYVVIDNALDDATCLTFRQEICSLKESGKLHLNSTHLVRAGKRSLVNKQGIHEAEVADQVPHHRPFVQSLHSKIAYNVLRLVLLQDPLGQKRHVFCVVQAVQRAAPAIAAFQKDRTMLTMLSIFLPKLRLHSQLVKLQFNDGERHDWRTLSKFLVLLKNKKFALLENNHTSIYVPRSVSAHGGNACIRCWRLFSPTL